MSLLTEQEKEIATHLISVLKIVSNDFEEEDDWDENSSDEEINQSIFNSEMKKSIIDAMDILGKRIGRKAMTKEFKLDLG